MKLKLREIFFFLILSVAFFSCSNNKIENNRLVVGIPADVESLNPMYAINVNEGNVTELLYLSLVEHNWNEEKGEIESAPMLAKSWRWNNDSTEVTLNLRNDVYWSDSVKFTAQDVVFSFDVYSDPKTESVRYGTFEKFYTDTLNHINIAKTFDIVSPTKLKLYFLPHSVPSLFDIDIPIIPKHIFEKIDRKNLTTAEENFHPVSDGPYRLVKWERNQSVILKANENSVFYKPGMIAEVVFKVVPDYNSRLTQLKNGEVDLVEDIKTEDVPEIRKEEKLKIVPVKGREYDYIGWNNIDPEKYNRNKKVAPNKFFGNPKVRKALTYAINRKEILEEFMGNFGEIAVGPVTPIFKGAVDTSIKPYNYNIELAKQMLDEAGWKDKNKDGIREKGGRKFSFTLYVPSNNPRRKYAANVVKNSLKAIGVDAKIEMMELGVFINNLYEKKFNAWIVGWYVPVPIDLHTYWYSDLEQTPLNFVSYQNKEIDNLLNRMEKESSKKRLNKLYVQFQKIIHQDEPVTFLYWIDNLTAYNKRIENADINPLGVVHHVWKWSLKN